MVTDVTDDMVFLKVIETIVSMHLMSGLFRFSSLNKVCRVNTIKDLVLLFKSRQRDF